MAHIDALERLARDLVGDGKSPNIYFVTDGGAVVAIVVDDEDDALHIAQRLGEGTSVVVEDRQTGVVWENRTSELEQEREED